jgi:hypothetical protein
MTAEVVVMNRNGIALAADSAVTVGRTAAKTYASADKLFQLAENAPVGIMFYGNSSFLRVPWETIIKAYRSQLGSRVFPRLTDYVSDFVRFVGTQKQMFSAAEQKRFVRAIVTNFFSYLRDELPKVLRDAPSGAGTLNEAEVKRLFTKLVRRELGRTRTVPKCDRLPHNMVQAVRNRYRNVIAAARREIFEKLPISQLTQRRLIGLTSELLTSTRLEESGLGSGVVIAGFGDNGHYPTLVELTIHGMARGHLLYTQTRILEVGEVSDGWLVPFAQREMVATFMDGIDPRLSSMMET